VRVKVGRAINTTIETALKIIGGRDCELRAKGNKNIVAEMP